MSVRQSKKMDAGESYAPKPPGESPENHFGGVCLCQKLPLVDVKTIGCCGGGLENRCDLELFVILV